MDVETLSIEELEKRIWAGGEDAIACVHVAEKLIREETARSGAPDYLATALFRLWRQRKIAVRTMRDGVLEYYIPCVA